MAEAIALYLANKIGDALVTEGINQAKAIAKSLTEVHGQMRDIKRRLELMQAFLQHADEHRNEDKVVAAWVKLVREVVFDIEYLVDLYTYTMASGADPKDENIFTGWLHKGFRKAKKMKPLKHISDELQGCYARLDNLSKDKLTFDIKTPDASQSSSSKALIESKKLAESAHTIPDENIIGVEDHKDKLINWLKDNHEKKRRVISVWGMGGVGKTTLVTSVYNSPSVVTHFECRAWVSVSQNYDRDDLLRKVIMELKRENKSNPSTSLECKDYRDMAKTLTKLLKQKRYLIILDDIWVTTVWYDLVNVICENDMQSRVIITTRNQDVAHIANESHVLELKPLSEKNARTLFYNKVFIKRKGRDCPTSLKEWAEKFLQKCGGLPLALIWIANYLATKEQSVFAWKSSYSMLVNSREKNDVNTILSLSIFNLPYYLRNCFLYCSIFPEDYKIQRKRLLRLWVSERFIVKERMETNEIEIAEDYLNQLVGRSMFQVVKRNAYGRVKSLKIHDFVREMILEKQRYESFYEICDTNIQRGEDRDNVRCLSIIKSEEKSYYNNQLHYALKLRTLHFFSKSTSGLPWSNFKLLCVLNLEGNEVECLPEELYILFNLRYLSIRGTKVKQLSKGISKLQNLQTLDVPYSCEINLLRQGIAKLHKLQHLLVHFKNGEDMKGIQNLKHLQTLKKVPATSQLLQELRSLTMLRSLDVEVSTTKASLELSACVAKMKHLVSLRIGMKSSDKLNLDGDLTELPRGLEKLFLWGSLEMGNLPKCLRSSNNLKLLKFFFSDLEEDPIPILAASSPDLCYLLLDQMCIKYGAVDTICFPVGSFTNLVTLVVSNLCIEMLEIQENSLVCLERMVLNNCYQMKALPIGIENLANLNQLKLDFMSPEFIEKLHEERPSKLQRIPLLSNFGHPL